MCVHLFSASHAERLIKSAVVVAKVRTSFTTLPFITIRRHAATVSLCTSRPQHRGYKTSIGSLLTRRRRGVPAKRTLRVVLRGQCTARGDRLRCSRDPGSNYPTGLTAPKANRPRCRQRRHSLAKCFIRCRSAGKAGGELSRNERRTRYGFTKISDASRHKEKRGQKRGTRRA